MDKKETTRLLNNLLEYNRVDINNLKSVFPDVGDAFMNVILAIDEEYGSGNIDKTLLTKTISQPTSSDFKVGDKVKIPKSKLGVVGDEIYFNSVVEALTKKQDFLYITKLGDPNDKRQRIMLWWEKDGKGTGDIFSIEDLVPYDEPVTNNQTQNLPFKVGDEFQNRGIGTVYVISAINANKIDIKWTDNKGKTSITNYDIKDANQYFNDKNWILVDKNTTPASVTSSSINYITNWRPEWKAMGLRPSPTRKASLENDDALGLGNDGIIYAIATDKNGTKKWKKTLYTSFNKNNRDEFSQVYDRNMLIDQLNYENSQLDKTDVDYKDNEKLIKQVLTEVQ